MALEINTEIFTHAFSNASGVGGKPRLARILQVTESWGICNLVSVDDISRSVWDRLNWNCLGDDKLSIRKYMP